MITNVEIHGFKRFSRCFLTFAPLTVLTGTNGAGKTSVIHSLLLAHEASLPGARTVRLNGPFDLQLGRAQDVLNYSALDNSEIVVAIQFRDGHWARVALDATKEQLLYLPIEHAPDRAHPLGGTQREMIYLSAERLGPRDVLGSDALPSDDLGVGVRGEFCAQVLAVHGLDREVDVPRARRHPDQQDDVDAFLKYHTETWLSQIVRPIEIDAVVFPNASVTALRFRAPGGEWVRAPNMGFGVSYALPIVLAGLFAKDGALLIVENPEAHLHPAGQSKIGWFLAQLAAAGVQVLVETHSDHVLNGVRRAIGEGKLLAADDAIVHFFDDAGERQPDVTTLHFSPDGGLDNWPRRFFDQYQIDVAALARVRRRPRSP